MKRAAVHLEVDYLGIHGVCGHMGETTGSIDRATCRACLRLVIKRGEKAQAQLDALNIGRKS